MDLVTLVTACALSVEPKLMHALIWHQAGGEPWAVSVRNEPMPRVYSSMQEAISEIRAASVANGIVRVGLAGLPLPPSKVNAAVFLPCLNVAIAAQRIAGLPTGATDIDAPRRIGSSVRLPLIMAHGSSRMLNLRKGC